MAIEPEVVDEGWYSWQFVEVDVETVGVASKPASKELEFDNSAPVSMFLGSVRAALQTPEPFKSQVATPSEVTPKVLVELEAISAKPFESSESDAVVVSMTPQPCTVASEAEDLATSPDSACSRWAVF